MTVNVDFLPKRDKEEKDKESGIKPSPQIVEPRLNIIN